jgi:hypothetical protein
MHPRLQPEMATQQVWRQDQALSIGIKGGGMPNLGGRKMEGGTGCHQLQSMAVANSKALIGGRGGIHWNRVVGLEPEAGASIGCGRGWGPTQRRQRMGSNRPRRMSWVQPPYKIHPNTEWGRRVYIYIN